MMIALHAGTAVLPQTRQLGCCQCNPRQKAGLVLHIAPAMPAQQPANCQKTAAKYKAQST